MSSIKNVIKNSGVYSIVSFLQKAIGFILLPVYTIYLSTSDYGIISIVTAMISFLSVFYMLSLQSSISRFYYDYKDDSEKTNQLFGTILNFILLLSIALTLIFIIFKDYLIAPFTKGIPFYPYIFIGILVVFLNPVYLIFQTILQTKQESKSYALNQFLFFIINLSLTVLLVVFFNMKAKGVLYAILFTNIIFFAYSVIHFIPIIKTGINFGLLKVTLIYSLPLLPHSLSAWSITLIDRFFINGLVGTSNVGIYNVGFQIASIVGIISIAINQAFVPWFFDKMKNNSNSKNEIIKFAEFINLGICIVAFMISLFCSDILHLMVSENYRIGWKVVPFICFGSVLNNLYFFFVNPLFFNKSGTKYIPIITIISAVLGIILNIILIPLFGIIGSAIANLTSWLFTSIIALLISNKIEKINYRVGKMYFIIILFFSVSLLTFIPLSFSFATILSIKILLLISVFAIIWFTNMKEYRTSLQIVYSKFK